METVGGDDAADDDDEKNGGGRAVAVDGVLQTLAQVEKSLVCC